MTPGLTAALAAAAAAVAGPMLAAWSASLTDPTVPDWWRYRPVARRRRLLVTVAAIALTAPASTGRPFIAWWLFAAGGAVLSVVDVQTQRLPARLTYPLALAVTAVLTVSAVADRDAAALRDAVVAALIVAGGYLAIRFMAPSSLAGVS